VIGLDGYLEEIFRLATGWLGWPPETALHTPIPQIILAIDGKADFVSKTNPFGPARKKTDAEKLKDQRNLFQRRKLDAAQRIRDMKASKHG